MVYNVIEVIGLSKKYSLGSNYRYIYSKIWAYDKKIIIFALIEIILLTMVPLIEVSLPSVVIGLLEKKASIATFIKYIIVLFGAFGVIFAFSTYFKNRNNMQYIMIRNEVFLGSLVEKSMRINYELWELEDTQKAFQKASNSVGGNSIGIEGFMHSNVDISINILGLSIYTVIASSISPLILVVLIVISILSYFVFVKAKNYELKQKDTLAYLNVSNKYYKGIGQDVSGGKDIRLYKLQSWLSYYYNKTNKEKQKILFKQNGFYYIYDLTGILLKFLRDFISYGYLIYLLSNGMDISLFVLYLGIISGFSTWFTKISEDVGKITRANLMIEDYRLFLDKDTLEEKIVSLDFSMYHAFDIVFDHVSYMYKNSDKFILQDLSFHIKDQEKLALVGVNGAGKTTIVKLICGFYKPCSGTIYVNGININDINHNEYLNYVAAIFQQNFIFSYSIAENISCSVIEKEELMNKSINSAGLDSKVQELPEKINTYLNKDIKENGISLSGGEIQKLMLARALYKESKMLILDEPTAALDAISESNMYEKYNELTKNQTVIFISHRLCSTKFCDRIIYLECGKIVEEGTHEDLLNLNGRYAEMFNVQSQYYKEGDQGYEVKTSSE